MTRRVHLSVSYLFAFWYCSWSSQGKNTEVVCHSLLQLTTFCQNSPPWPILLGWPYTAWLTVSLSYTRLWSLWSVWLVFCDCGFHSALWWIRRGLWKLPDGRYCFTFNLSHFTAEETVPRKLSIFSKALQFSLSAQTRRWVSQFLVHNTFAAICNLNLYS